MQPLKTLFCIYALAAVIRYGLINSSFKAEIENRVEVSTPINSFARVVESLYREEIGVNPYSSDLLHETPVHLYFYKLVLTYVPNCIDLVFIASDILAAHFLYLFAARYMFRLYIEQTKSQNCAVSPPNLLVKGKDFLSPPLAVAMIYLFNPYSIINCVGYSTTVFINLLLAVFFAGLAYESVVFSIISLVVCSCQSFYFMILLSPLFLTFKNKAYWVVAGFFLTMGAFLGLCMLITGDFSFLSSTYGFIWSVNDQQPNIGVFWYFFMEMFEHFRSLFIFSYQINVLLLYFIPLSIKYRDDPVLLATCFVSIIAIFKSYPSVGDIAFVFGVLPCWKHLYSCMQQVFISAVTIIVTTALAPILWDLWIYWGSANANFYFGTSLAFITAQIFLLTDIAFAYTKRKYLLLNGNNKCLNGKPAKLVLQ